MGTSNWGHPVATEKLHRVAVQLGAAAAVATIAIYGVWAVADGDPIHLINSIGPAVLGIVGLIMLRRRTHRGEIILILAALSTIVSFKSSGGESASAPAAIRVVMIVSVSALFVSERWKWHHVWFGGLIPLATGVFWEGLHQRRHLDRHCRVEIGDGGHGAVHQDPRCGYSVGSSLSDSGRISRHRSGKPVEDTERIFEPYAGARDRPGLAASVGLGLSVSRQLARLIGGDVVCEREGNASIFRLTLLPAEHAIEHEESLATL